MIKQTIQKSRRIFSVRFLITLIVVLLIAFAVSTSYFNGNQARLQGLLEVKRVKVEKKTLQKLVITTGKVETKDKQVLLAGFTGTLKEVYKSEGDVVAKDFELFQIETLRSGRKVKETVKSPGGYTMARIAVEDEQAVIAGQTVLAELVKTNELKITAEVPEFDVAKLKLDQTAKVVVSALANRELAAKVATISKLPIASGIATGSNSSYKVDLHFAPDQNLNGVLIGMSTDLEIEADRKVNALALNDSYIFKRDGKDYVKLFKSTDAGIELEDVEVGIGFRGETDVEITSGLKEADEVVLPTVEIRNSRGTLNFFRSGS